MPGGTVRCWGYNAYGQLGDGSTVNRTTPVHVSITNLSQITPGTYHTAASAGTARCGAGATTATASSATSPAPPHDPGAGAGPRQRPSVAAGGNHTCAIRTGGRRCGAGATTATASSATAPPPTPRCRCRCRASRARWSSTRASTTPARGSPAARCAAGATTATASSATAQLTNRTSPVAVSGISTAVELTRATPHLRAALRRHAALLGLQRQRRQLGDGTTATPPHPRGGVGREQRGRRELLLPHHLRDAR
jgi:hypothetical protein